jgi:hypothetical protein
MNPLQKILVLTGLLVFGLSPAVDASTYVSSNQVTALQLYEDRTRDYGGFYITKINNRHFFGDIKIISTQETGRGMLFTGTFQERSLGPGTKFLCSGNIEVERGSTIPVNASVTWRVTGGENCPDIGKTVTLDLVEPLPRANSKGDYTPENSDTWITQTSGFSTWPQWRVVSSDGELNCRTQPNGTVQYVYRAGAEPVLAELRQINAIEFSNSNGDPWLLTRKGCYVRANSQYIQPVSLPN